MDDMIRETVYEHIIGNDYFTITAAEKWSINMVLRLAAQRPDEVEIIAKNQDGSILAHMPKSWMRIVPKRKVSEEQRRAFAERRAWETNNTPVSQAVQ